MRAAKQKDAHHIIQDAAVRDLPGYKTNSAPELRKIQKRCDAAARGPWTSYVEGRDHTSGSNFIMTGVGEDRGEDIELTGATVADQDFIAHAKQDIPRLIEEIWRLKKMLRG